MNKVLFIQSFSKNIYDLNDLTMNNHIRYFNKHDYSFIFKNETYFNGLFNFKSVIKYFDEYSIVVTLGCDCIITNDEVPIESFSNNYITVSQESAFSHHFGTHCNGEIMVFNRKDDKLFSILNALDQMQHAERDSFVQQYKETPQWFYSTQSLFNNIYSGKYKHSSIVRSYVDYRPIGEIQSYINDYVKIQVLPDEEWRPGRFLLHVFGIPNAEKKQHIEDFLSKYPEYA